MKRLLTTIALVGELLLVSAGPWAHRAIAAPPCGSSGTEALSVEWICAAIAESEFGVIARIDEDGDVELVQDGFYSWVRVDEAHGAVVFFTIFAFQAGITHSQKEQLVDRLNAEDNGLIFGLTADGHLQIVWIVPAEMLQVEDDVVAAYIVFALGGNSTIIDSGASEMLA